MTANRTAAAVLVPVFRDREGRARLVLIVRAERGVHGGQLAFPGGVREPGDASLLETALREAAEEIGLARERVEVLEALPVFETRSTGFAIAPFLARIAPPHAWRPAPDEVAGVLEPALDELADPAARGTSLERVSLRPDPIEGCASSNLCSSAGRTANSRCESGRSECSDTDAVDKVTKTGKSFRLDATQRTWALHCRFIAADAGAVRIA